MDAFVITLFGNDYSEAVANRCIESANVPITRMRGVHRHQSRALLEKLRLRWSWGEGHGGMRHHSYGGDDDARIGCFLSHYLLWNLCAEVGRPFLILEHDAVFVRPFEPFEFDAICMINDPNRATPKGGAWHAHMLARGPGVWPKSRVFDDARPDGLAGNSAYCIQPHAAQALIDLADELGAWPNDALMCRQLVDGLQEHYPFITEVRSQQSTILV